MTQLQQEHVAGILEQVKDRLSPTSYNVWFENSTHLKAHGDTLTVGVPNLFVSDYVEARYGKLIAELACQQLGRDIDIRFEIDPDLFHERRQATLEETDGFETDANKKEAEAPAQKANAEPPARRRSGRRAETEPARPLLTLDQFVVGDCNRMAYAAATEVAEHPGQAFSPLFMHGGCGLGKTHLLQGIVNAVRHSRPGARVLYTTAEEFTNRYIMAIKTRSLDAFRHRFRGLDVLAIDDIHFLANKQATQEEFLHTFNAFHTEGRQVVMASDCHPRMLTALQQNLVSRFVAGMVVRLRPPDRATRASILRRKAERTGRELPDEVIDFIARHVARSIRELEGALLRVIAYATLDKRPITLSLARDALADHLDAHDKAIGLEHIVETVARFFNVAAEQLCGNKRTRSVTLPRQAAMYLARKLTSLSFPEIGRLMGGKNHTTVLAACKRMEKMVSEDQTVVLRDGSVERTMTAAHLIEAIEDHIRR